MYPGLPHNQLVPEKNLAYIAVICVLAIFVMFLIIALVAWCIKGKMQRYRWVCTYICFMLTVTNFL